MTASFWTSGLLFYTQINIWLWNNQYVYIILYHLVSSSGWCWDGALTFEPSSLCLIPGPTVICASQVGRCITRYTIPRMTLNQVFCLPADVRETTVSFMKHRQVIAGTLNKFNILALTCTGFTASAVKHAPSPPEMAKPAGRTCHRLLAQYAYTI